MTRTTIDFGIDLGTTNSEIAVFKGTAAEIIENNDGTKNTPSCVWINKRDEITVGQRAKERVEQDPDNAFFEFKLRMGSDAPYQFKASGRRMKPEELSAEVLKSLKKDVQQRLGEDLQAAVITVPAAFELPQTDATQRAARLAGIETSPLILEPTAAALAYGFQSNSDKVFWLAYDLGGGTFDAALIQMRDGQFQLVSHKGDNHLGGKNLDWKIVEELLVPAILKQVRLEDFQRGNPRWQASFAKLKLAAESAKILLSRSPHVTLEVYDLVKDQSLDFEYQLTRDAVANLAEPIIRRSIAISREVMAEARLGKDHIEKLLLVGGPLLAPYVREMLEDPVGGLGIPLEFSINPFTVVAQGAAIFAGTQRLQAARKSTSVQDVNEYLLELAYQPVGSDEDPVVGGKVLKPGGGSLEGFTLEFTCQTWKSGRVKIQAGGAFLTVLHAERGIQNHFKIALYDPQGGVLKASPDSLVYTIGNAPTDPPIINPMGVALANNEVIWYFQKGQSLPSRRTEVLKTVVDLRKGISASLLKIVVVEGENSKADRNKNIGSFEINGTTIRRDIPVGSDVEVTMYMDQSRLLTVKAYIPILDEEFEATNADLKRNAASFKTLESELKVEKERLRVLQEQAESAEDPQVDRGLRAIQDEKKVQVLEGQVAAARADEDAALEAQNRLLELKIQLDEIEERLKWPTLVDEANQKIASMAEFDQQADHPEAKKAANTLEREIRQAVVAKDPDLLRRKIDELDKVRFDILLDSPQWWVGFLYYLEENDKTRMSDQVQAARLFAEGHRAVDKNDLPKLQNAVRQLLNILPEKERQAISSGYGSSLGR